MCAVRLRSDEHPTVVSFFRQCVRSIAEQQTPLDEPLYLAMSGARAHAIDTTLWDFRCVNVKPDERDEVWRQFVGYKRLIDRVEHDYAGRLDDVWLLFSDGDDLWSPTRYKIVKQYVNEWHNDSGVTTIVDAMVTKNVDENEATTFTCAHDVDDGLRRRRIVTETSVTAVQEYTNFCVRFYIAREFFAKFSIVLDAAVVDRFFATFVATYGHEQYRSLRYYSDSWEYFYRQHHTSVSRENLVGFSNGVSTIIHEQCNRNVDLLVFLGCYSDNREQKQLLTHTLSRQPMIEKNVAALIISSMAQRLCWWKLVAAPSIGVESITLSVMKLTNECIHADSSLRNAIFLAIQQFSNSKS